MAEIPEIIFSALVERGLLRTNLEASKSDGITENVADVTHMALLTQKQKFSGIRLTATKEPGGADKTMLLGRLDINSMAVQIDFGDTAPEVRQAFRDESNAFCRRRRRIRDARR
ncbi:hypothetical protein ACFL2C_00450 [Patescibacteria group bacterium]